ncbi:cardiolipin synthase [Acetobacter sacchari]|uniref:Cardiolipin synthase n=1 Tax=Acetobacter sacchari TaxID=2661687 RepID=A0ABS3M0M8_9PROT|nr:cardiolipin synthase [Acetobacter sacchari]MBO1361718.1 cardiolipin synthase [Acetobacter sacchari]
MTLSALRVLLALAVTIHVLLTKRDTAAAIGWIGMAALMPVLGSILYLMFGINRVKRLARKLVRQRGAPGSAPATRWQKSVEGRFAPLASMVGKLTSRSLVGGNNIEMLHDGDEAYPAMLDAIQRANTSVLLCSYIFRADRVGGLFIDALIDANNRGVAVRVLVDGVGAGYFSCPTARRLRRAGVPCGRFMHSLLPWSMPFINLRNHRKSLIIDGVLGFIGGLNIGDENMVADCPRDPVSDTHFRVRGPIVRQLAAAFAWDWTFTEGEDLAGPTYFPDIDASGTDLMRIVTAGPDTDLEKIEFVMLQAMTLARSSIRLMTPYFLPGTRLSTELCLAALRGVTVDIVIPQRSNHVVMDWACRADIHPVLDAGCRVWSAPPPFNHSKLLVVDREWSFVGSSNLDMRSLRLNFEINLETYNAEFSQRVDDFIVGHCDRRVTHHDLDKRNYLTKLRDSGARLLSPYL